MMKKIVFKGCGTAIVTPFTKDGINFEEFGKMIDYQISNKIDAIIVCGTSGESATMTEKEKKDVIKFAIDKVNKRVPVIAGTGSNSTAVTIEMTRYAYSCGADACLIVTPFYNKTTQAGLYEHYKTIANKVPISIILYNVPSRTGLNIDSNTCKKLSEINNIIAIKEASSNISQIVKTASLCKDNLNIYSGNDDQILPILSVGGIGVISVVSNILPEYMHNLVYDYLNGNYSQSMISQLNIIELVNILFSEVNPIPIKEALNIIGFNAGIPRLPLVEMTKEGSEKLKKCISNYKISL